ncbi:unnamed protein product, partial [Symbiodinium pilosum]
HLYDGAPLDELRELCGHLKKDMGSCDVPTLLLADLSFPEKAVEAQLKWEHNIQHIHFAPIPYPTNICK